MLAEHTWCIWLGLAMAVGLLVTMRALPRFFARQPIRDFERWLPAVERASSNAVRASLYAAAAQKELVELIGELPKDFEPTVWLACNVAQGVQRSVLVEAERQGLIPAGMLARVYGVQLDEGSTPPASSPEPRASTLPENVVWIDGRQVPQRVSR